MLKKLVDVIGNGVNKITVKRVSEQRSGDYGDFKGMIVIYEGEEYNQLLKPKDYDLGFAGNKLIAIKNKSPKGYTVFLTQDESECISEDARNSPISHSNTKQVQSIQTENRTHLSTNNKDLQIASLAIFKSVYDRSKSIEECIDESIKGAKYLISKV